MNIAQIRQVIKEYRTYLGQSHLFGDSPQQTDHHLAPTRGEALRHLLSMCDRMEEFANATETAIKTGEPLFNQSCQEWDKLNRWLGFMQGTLWSQGVFTLSELRAHNRNP